MLLRFILVLLMSLMLFGCVSMPKSPEAFRADAFALDDFVVERSLRDAYVLVAENTIRCHQGDQTSTGMVGGLFFVFPSGSTRVEGRIDPEEGTAVVTVKFANVSASGLLQVIDFQRISASQTKVSIYRANDSKKWRTATEAAKGWFQGGAACYNLY